MQNNIESVIEIRISLAATYLIGQLPFAEQVGSSARTTQLRHSRLKSYAFLLESGLALHKEPVITKARNALEIAEQQQDIAPKNLPISYCTLATNLINSTSLLLSILNSTTRWQPLSSKSLI